jgi:hypothetical protein
LARLLLLAKPSPLQQNGNKLNIGQASLAGQTLASATEWQYAKYWPGFSCSQNQRLWIKKGYKLNIGLASPAGKTLASATKWQ